MGSAAGEHAFIALGYESKKKLALIGAGTTGGFASLRPLLADDAVIYGAFKLSAGGTPKLCFVASIGENAGGMVKGRATAHTQIVENALEGTTIGIQLAESDECEPAAVAAKLSKTLKVEVTL